MRISGALLFTSITFVACATSSHTGGGPAPPPTVQLADQGSQLSNDEIGKQLFAALNQQRTADKLEPLAMSPELARSAQEHSDRMASGIFLNTRGADEPSVITRISSQGVKTLKIGEDVGRLMTRPDRVADETMSLWMGAAANRKNILSPAFTRAGIGVAHAPDGDYYLSADFAQ